MFVLFQYRDLISLLLFSFFLTITDLPKIYVTIEISILVIKLVLPSSVLKTSTSSSIEHSFSVKRPAAEAGAKLH